jgi:release factor glutamine methyltransferase
MEVRSNRIGDIRIHYKQKLCKIYDEKEADTLMFMVISEYAGYSKAKILSNHEDTVSESQLLKIHFAVKELLKEKPVQYVLGKTEFYGLPFIVNSKVLIPRPETEELAEMAISYLKYKSGKSVIDLGTGSGCLAVTIKKNISDAIVMAIDVSEFALEVAAINAEINEVEIKFQKLDLLEPATWRLNKSFDVIISNPPYVRESEKKLMAKNVLEYEPAKALFVSNEDPLIFYKQIIKFSEKLLVPGGSIFCEANQYLEAECKDLFENENFENIKTYKDFRNNFRIISCVKPFPVNS